MHWKIVILLSVLLGSGSYAVNAQTTLWKSGKSLIKFESDAPLELIKAESKSSKGIIDPLAKTFAITMKINSFVGFNSEMQKIHFQENYMEQDLFPEATFQGKIIEDVPFDKPGTYEIRAKGNLQIHGIVRERIIKCTLLIRDGSACIQSSFVVPVSDHGINIPKIVNQKIAEQIMVTIDIEFSEDIKS